MIKGGRVGFIAGVVVAVRGGESEVVDEGRDGESIGPVEGEAMG